MALLRQMTQMYAAFKNTPRIHCRAQEKQNTGRSSEKMRQVRSRSTRKSNIVEEFSSFEEYLRFANSKHKNETKELRTEKPREHRGANRRLQVEQNSSTFQAGQKQNEEIVLPYFEHYRCQIKAAPQRSKSQFRVRRNSFRLNFRIIQENMGKAGQSK